MIIQIILTTLIITILLIVLIIIYKKAEKARIKKQEAIKREDLMEKSFGVDKTIKNPLESLHSLNKIAKRFFKEYLKEKYELTYREFAEKFKLKKDPYTANFCEKMNYLLYSGKKVSREEVLDMIEEFYKIVKEKS